MNYFDKHPLLFVLGWDFTAYYPGRRYIRNANSSQSYILDNASIPAHIGEITLMPHQGYHDIRARDPRPSRLQGESKQKADLELANVSRKLQKGTWILGVLLSDLHFSDIRRRYLLLKQLPTISAASMQTDERQRVTWQTALTQTEFDRDNYLDYVGCYIEVGRRVTVIDEIDLTGAVFDPPLALTTPVRPLAPEYGRMYLKPQNLNVKPIPGRADGIRNLTFQLVETDGPVGGTVIPVKVVPDYAVAVGSHNNYWTVGSRTNFVVTGM